MQIPSAAKQHYQRHGEHKRGNRIADNHRPARHRVEFRPVMHGFGNAQRNGHQINNQRRPQSQRHGHGHLFLYQFRHARIAVKAFPEIEQRIVFHHQSKTRQNGLVKAELVFQFLYQGGIKPLRPAVFRRHRAHCRGFGGLRVVLQLCRDMFDGTARGKLGKQKVDRHNSE